VFLVGGALKRGATFKNAAIAILAESMETLHYRDIAERALSRGLISTSGKTPADSMGSRIATDLKSNGRQSAFIKTAPGYYRLNPEYGARIGKTPDPQNGLEKPTPKQAETGPSFEEAPVPKEPLENQYTGKAGEYLVASKLLFLGYNTSILAVDSGADLVAIKNEKPFHIQVKTAHLKGKRYSFNITKASLDRHYHGGMYYVFVLREGTSPHGMKESFLIFPLNTIEEYISRGYIKPHRSRKIWTTTVTQHGNSLSLGTKENNVDYNKDKWCLIK